MHEDQRPIETEVPELIPDWVDTLHHWTRMRRPAAAFAIPARKDNVVRTDPCPCGGGRKDKKCCAAAA